MKSLMDYAGSYRYLTGAAFALSAISSLTALVPFFYIWRIISQVLETAPHFENAAGVAHDGWMALAFSILSMLIYVAALWCSHLCAFRVQRNIRCQVMEHILKLPAGFMNDWGSGKVRKIVNDCSASTETYLAHIWPDKAGMIFTPLGLIVLLLFFDWRLGLLCLVPVGIAFIFMAGMMGDDMKAAMKEYQNSLETMSSEAVEYIRGVPVVKTSDRPFSALNASARPLMNTPNGPLPTPKACARLCCVLPLRSTLFSPLSLPSVLQQEPAPARPSSY